MTRLRLDKLLVERGIASSRDEARRLIEQGSVSLGGLPCRKPASLAAADARIDVAVDEGERRWVSRGAHKLLKALDVWDVDPAGKNCIDIGASTGGFTEVLLSRGANRVAAVDVGYGQLAWSLRQDARVQVAERTNARYLTLADIGWAADLIVTDASFISLRLLLPAIRALLLDQGRAILLVKPQFEVGRAKVGSGVVRDPALHVSVLRAVAGYAAENGFVLLAADFSPIRGPEGNIEFLFLLAPKESGLVQECPDFDKLIIEAHSNFNRGDEVD